MKFSDIFSALGIIVLIVVFPVVCFCMALEPKIATDFNFPFFFLIWTLGFIAGTMAIVKITLR